MAKIKYAEGVEKLLNEHSGYTFQPNNYGQSTFPASKSGRFRRPSQNKQQQNLMKAVTFWRDMDYTTKNNWNTFAATYPQASRRKPDTFLSGYQLFLKRCHYCFLNNGITSDFMTEPTLEELEVPEFTVEIKQSDNSLDCSENYLKYFGRFPKAGDFVLCKIYPMAENSGQFFEPIELTISVDEIYFDGLFLSFNFAGPVPNVVFSVYLSKVVYQSVNYIGTKIRYMGCFTPKTFKALTDVPAVTAADDGKVWGVGPDGTWQLIEAGGGGGLTCEDLAECPTIISMQEMINSIGILVSISENTSIPAVKFGLLYNYYCVLSEHHLNPSGCHMPSLAEILSISAAFGGDSVSGGHLQEPDLNYWISLMSGNDNLAKFNARGASFRNISGAYNTFKSTFRIALSDLSATDRAKYIYINYNNIRLYNSAYNYFRYGTSIRFIKDTTTLTEGESGTLIGNSGRIYRTICLAGLEIMADNFADTIFRDGTPIPYVENNTDWSLLSTPAYCFPNGLSSNV